MGVEKTGTEIFRPALCLDLDGTIRYSASGQPFIKGPEDIRLFPGVEENIWKYRNDEYLIIGITNQGGVGAGYKTIDENDAELDAMVDLFDNNPFHAIYSCVSFEGGSVYPYNKRSLLRKPNIGLLVQAELHCLEHGYLIDWDNSLFVGDRPEDQACAANASIDFQWAWHFFGRDKPEK